MASTPRCAALTLFAGRPLPGAALTSWDAECGFSADQDVVGIRRDEDRQALDMLGARAIWLNFRDDQYGEPRREDALVRALAGVIDDVVPHAIYFPLGLFHRDHRRSSDAALALVARLAPIRWYAYEDAIYRRIDELASERRGTLGASGFALERFAFASAGHAALLKRNAVHCYRSQLRGLRTRSSHDDVLAPESYWRVERASHAR